MTRLMRHVGDADVLENAAHLDAHADLVHAEHDRHVVVMRTRTNDTQLHIWRDVDGTALVIGRPVVGPQFQIVLDPNVPMSALLALMEHA